MSNLLHCLLLGCNLLLQLGVKLLSSLDVLSRTTKHQIRTRGHCQVPATHVHQLVLVRQRLIVSVHNSVHLLGQLVLLGNRLCVIFDSLVVGLSYGNQVSP